MEARSITSDFALDVNSVAKLKYSARQASDGGLGETAKQFEALFLQKMLKQMRDAIPQSNLLNSQRSEMYQSLMDQQWAQTLSERGVGLADMLTRELGSKGKTAPVNGAQSASTGNLLAGIPKAAPIPLKASEAIDASPSAPVAKIARAQDNRTAQPPLRAAENAPAGVSRMADNTVSATDKVRQAVLPPHVNDFLQRMEPAARVASEQTGIPKRLILAQAALETGWGRHETRRDDGRPSYNVFNIKATGWQGESTRVRTTEYEGGRAQSMQASFRAYDSYEQAFSDYARLLTESPRYEPVVNAPDARTAAYALQNCGYATDPAYAQKLVSIMSRLPEEEAVAAIDKPSTAAHGAPAIDLDQATAIAQYVQALQSSVDADTGSTGLQLARAETRPMDLTRLF